MKPVWFALVVVFCLGLTPSPGFGSEQGGAAAARLVDDLRVGDLPVRMEAAARLASLPVGQRPGTTVPVVVAELRRVQEVFEAGKRLDGAPQPGSTNGELVEDDSEWRYYSDLLDIACESRNPIVIPVLVEAVGVGHPVTDAVARFGENGAAQLLAVLRHRDNDPAFVASALPTFRQMLTGGRPLSRATKIAIADVVRKRLSGSQASPVVREAILVGQVLGDASVDQRIALLRGAESTASVGLTIVDSGSLEGVLNPKAPTNGAGSRRLRD